MIQTYNLGIVNFHAWEWIAISFIIIVSYFIAVRIKTKKLHLNNAYKFLLPALLFKISAGIFFAIIYVFYYGGGDTISYYSSTLPLVNLFFENPGDYFDIIMHSSDVTSNFGIHEWEAYTFNVFDANTGIPLSFISHDPKTFAVCKLTSFLLIPTFNSYFACTVLLAVLTFIPLWKLYLIVLTDFPVLEKELAIGILFIPSVLFWGSGIMKDTYTFSAVCFAVYAVASMLKTKKYLWNIIILLIAFYTLLSIKPYILNILIPSFAIWVFALSLLRVKNIIFRIIIFPLILVSSLGGSYLVLNSLGESMDKFALDSAVQTAVITNNDLKRTEQYGDNNFDIGTLDGTISGMLSKFPQAVFAGLFRPMLFEAKNIVMLLSGIENSIILAMLLLTFYRVKFRLIINLVKTTPFLIFCVSFSILFAFMLGITTPNFGALVRFRIPLTPFFTCFIMVILNTKKIVLSEIPK